MNKYPGFLMLLLTGNSLFAETKPQTLRDYMNSDGKIHILIAVTFLIIIGFGISVFFLDRKLRKALKK